MSFFRSGPLSPFLAVAPIRALLFYPKKVLPPFLLHPTPLRPLILGYVLPLMAIAPLARLIGGQVAGLLSSSTKSLPLLVSLRGVVAYIIIGLIAFAASAEIVCQIAPLLNLKRNRKQAYRLLAFAGTPAWLAGLVYLVPGLGPLSLAGAGYTLYLIYIGVPQAMTLDDDDASGYVVLALVAVVAVHVVFGLMILPMVKI
jgi:hypothetical protein